MIRMLHDSTVWSDDRDAMFRGRRRVFVDRLKWPLAVDTGGREIDEFDGLDPLYLLAIDKAGQVAGSIRLMPTTGPTLLTGPFRETFDEPVDLRSPGIWEATRFCVHPDARETTPTAMNRATAELCLGLAEVGLRAGLTHIVGVYNDRMIRIYSRIGWMPDRLASSRDDRGVPVHVGLWTVDEAALATMCERSGIADDVLTTTGTPGAPLRRAG